jgi:hypothetical protein
MAFGALRRFCTPALRRRALVGSLLALERRRIAHPRLRTTRLWLITSGICDWWNGLQHKFALQKQRAISQWASPLNGLSRTSVADVFGLIVRYD